MNSSLHCSLKSNPFSRAISVILFFAVGFTGLFSFGKVTSATEKTTVYLIELEGDITPSINHYVQRAIAQAGDSTSSIIVISIRSFGGEVSAATGVKDSLLSAPSPVYAYVHGHAISAGALIALACKEIYMSPGSVIGAATPFSMEKGSPQVNEKMTSAVRAVFRSTAEARKHPAKLSEAMVDPSIEIEGITTDGKLLTLTAGEAVKFGIAQGMAKSVDEFIETSFPDSQTIPVKISPAEIIASAIGSPLVSGLLISVALLALLTAIKVPGTGAAEFIALGSFALLLWGKYIIGLAGWEEMVLIGFGVVMLLLEIFVIPGFGIAGTIGLASLLTGLILLSVHHSPSMPFFWPELRRGITTVALSMALTGLGAFVGWRALKDTSFWRKFTLNENENEFEDMPDYEQEALSGLTGAVAVTLTVLRPEGYILLNDRKYPARSEKGYIDNKKKVIVKAIKDKRAVVTPAPEE